MWILDPKKLEQMVAAGFEAVQYDRQDGTFLRKNIPVNDLPFMAPYVDDDVVLAGDTICIELCPDQTLQVVDMNEYVDFCIDNINLDSQTAQTILADAGVRL